MWNIPQIGDTQTTVWFGAGRIKELANACREAGIDNPLLITDRNMVSLPITQVVKDLLPNVKVFSEVDSNPTELNLNAGITVFKSGNHDGVVAFGGGSSLDLGKLIAFGANQTLPIWEFEDVGDNWKLADHSAISPIVAIPTTAGTGSEVGRAGVLTKYKIRC